jgi:hypothetical protein
MILTVEGGRMVKSLPISLLPGPLSGPASTVEGSSVATAGVSAGFILQLRDEFGNAQGDSFGVSPEASVQNSSNTLSNTPSMGYSGNGQFRIGTTLTVTGLYNLQVKLDGASVRRSPFRFHVGPAARNARWSRVQLNATTVAGVQGVIRVFAADRYCDLTCRMGILAAAPQCSHTLVFLCSGF